MQDYQKNYLKWVECHDLDPDTKLELASLEGNEDALKERFSSYMEFGTGGLRSKMGAGCGMMNLYTVAHVTEAVA